MSKLPGARLYTVSIAQEDWEALLADNERMAAQLKEKEKFIETHLDPLRHAEDERAALAVQLRNAEAALLDVVQFNYETEREREIICRASKYFAGDL